MENSKLLLGAAFGALVLTSITALAQPAPAPGAPPAAGGRGAAAPEVPPVSEEYLLLGSATRGAGEPMIAVDPLDPKTIAVVGMANLLQTPKPVAQIPGSTITQLALTHDGGASWTISELPMRSGDLVRCPDPLMDVTKDGNFIGGCEPIQATVPRYGESAISVSTDKGEHWGPVVETISSLSMARYAPGLKPVFLNSLPFDRPFTYVDDSTGAIYMQGAGGQTSADAPAGQSRPQGYITASTNGGKSFGTIYSWDSKDYMQASRGLSMTAGHGEAAVVYVAAHVPAKENATCPCLVMGITKDLGKTFDYHVLKNFTPVAAPPAAGGGGARPGPNGNPATGGFAGMSADFTKAGRYASLKYTVENGQPLYSVTVSDDHGKTWSPFVSAGKVPGATYFDRQLAFQFGRNGVLAVAWRAVYADGSYDVWSSLSKDGGHTFSESLKVSHAKSPPSVYLRSAQQNDDVVDLSMDNDNVHMVWGDNRAGFLGTWYGRVALSSYKF